MTIHRRTLLKSSIPALAGSIALGAVADSSATPIQRLYKEWQDASAKYERLADEGIALTGTNAHNHDDEVVTPAYMAMVAVEDRIIQQPIEGPQDLAIKVIIALGVEDAHDADQYRRLHSDAVGLLA